ncbi:hypothetical protein [Methylobacterium nigriterrae]|uniref:hypothetical protein n=1 Tax=Methylobacterium nigriterrae TaxID=3127512 RepID=UPI0030140CA1
MGAPTTQMRAWSEIMRRVGEQEAAKVKEQIGEDLDRRLADTQCQEEIARGARVARRALGKPGAPKPTTTVTVTRDAQVRRDRRAYDQSLPGEAFALGEERFAHDGTRWRRTG